MVNGEFILNNFGAQESDIVYKIRKNETTIYFVLLELQSKNDKMMAYRVLEYMLEIWRKYANRKLKLPLIIPCVLYTGKSKWTGSRNFNKLVENYKDYKKIIPNFEYIDRYT